MCLKTQLGNLQLQKLSVCSCSQTIVPFPKHSNRIYLVPLNAFNGRCGLRSFGTDSLSGVGGRHHQRHVIAGVLGPDVSQRYKATRLMFVIVLVCWMVSIKVIALLILDMSDP